MPKFMDKYQDTNCYNKSYYREHKNFISLLINYLKVYLARV
ncbi:hypothetical protein RMAECT_0481 [Rickettsia rhipicephali str. Ect]|uniref:Uncharacterized protein n=1 Tax=Rickettsia rhipicephali str. Ect TaxID=1359199 RepID=A0A0F3PE32_RICRH|nr:hypothetical protein RMAECT_0481 [Rickettsia rhipicephali str. Ect]